MQASVPDGRSRLVHRRARVAARGSRPTQALWAFIGALALVVLLQPAAYAQRAGRTSPVFQAGIDDTSVVSSAPSTADGAAARPPDASGADESAVPGLVLEEVVVYGSQTLNSLRLEVNRAEEAFYDAFNAVNSDDEFDVTCRTRALTGSRIRRRVCEAQFVKDLNEEFAEAWLRGDPLPPINPIMMQKGQQLVAEMRQVAEDNPLVLQSLLRLAEIQMKFKEEHDRRCKGRIFCGK